MLVVALQRMDLFLMHIFKRTFKLSASVLPIPIDISVKNAIMELLAACK